MMRWRTRFTYDDPEVELGLLLPCRPFIPRRMTIGGHRVVTSGATATYRRAQRGLLALELRVYEHEWPDFVELIDWCHANNMGPITIGLDQDESETDVEVYLESPAPNTEWEPVRDAEFPSLYLMQIVVRSTDGAPFNHEYFAEPA